MRYNSDTWIKRGPESHPGGMRNRTDIISALQIHSLNSEGLWVVNVLAEAVHVCCSRAVACDGWYTGDTQRARPQKKPAHSDRIKVDGRCMCCVFMEGLLKDRVNLQGSPCHLATAITPQPRSRSAFLIRLPRSCGVAGSACMFGGSSGQISRLTGQL